MSRGLEAPPLLSSSRLSSRSLRLAAVPVAAIVVVVAALALRVAFLGNQSYWGDELFSVNQSDGSLGTALAVGRTEVHTPLFATLLWVWIKLGGTSTLWTHALSGVFGLAAIVTSYVCLRSSPLSSRARWLAVALTAANGFGIVYSQETRPYALALLGATGLTAVTLAQVNTPQTPRGRAGLIWLAWATLTATTHLFGAVLVGATTLVLAGSLWTQRRRRDALGQLGLAILAVIPQAWWIVSGIDRSGFAQGTIWIKSPDVHSVRILLTTVFSAGGLVPRSDGFAWTSKAGLACAVVLMVVAGFLSTRRGAGQDGDRGVVWRTMRNPDVRLGTAGLLVASLVVLVTFIASQFVHLWTLRNFIVIVPALTWGMAWVIVGLPARKSARELMAITLLGLTLLSMWGVATSLAKPYKTDWRGLIEYLARERASQPMATFSFFGSGPKPSFLAADHTDLASLQHIYDRVDMHPRPATAIAGLRRLPGPQVAVFYDGVAHPRPVLAEREMMDRLGGRGCRTVPIFGFAVIACGT